MQTNSFTLRRLYTRIMTILAVLIALVASAFPGTGFAEGGWTLLNGTVTVINDGPGDLRDAHVSGDLVTYYSAEAGSSYVRYYNFLTGTDAAFQRRKTLLISSLPLTAQKLSIPTLPAPHTRSISSTPPPGEAL